MENVEQTELEETQVEVTEPENQEEKEPVESTESEEPKAEKLPEGVKKRLAKITAEKYAYKEQLRLERLKNQDLTKEPEIPEPTQFMDNYGNVDKIRYKMAIDAYTDAKTNYKASREEVQQADAFDQQEQMENRLKFMEQVVEVKKKNPEILEAMQKSIWTPQLESLIYASDEGARIVLYLGKNDAEAKRIAALPIREMQNELELLEQRVKVQPRTVSGAPKALTPVDDSKFGQSAKDIDPTKDPQGWFEAREREKLKKLKGK